MLYQPSRYYDTELRSVNVVTTTMGLILLCDLSIFRRDLPMVVDISQFGIFEFFVTS